MLLRRATLRSFFSGATLFVLFALPAHASGGGTSVAAPGSWRDPLTLRWRAPIIRLELQPFASAGVPPTRLARALEKAAAAWNDTGAAAELVIDQGEGEGEGEDDAVFGEDGHNRVGLYRGGDWPFPKEAAAVTRTWKSDDGTHLVEADVALNPAIDWAGDGGAFDAENALTHELGHVLGLPDIHDARDATMFYMMLPGETLKRDLAHADEQMLFSLYQGIDAPEDGGCSSTSGQPAAPALLFPLVALMSRRLRRVRAKAAAKR